MIERQRYLNQLISKKENGLIKVITGIRRCGKSYLLFKIYHQEGKARWGGRSVGEKNMR